MTWDLSYRFIHDRVSGSVMLDSLKKVYQAIKLGRLDTVETRCYRRLNALCCRLWWRRCVPAGAEAPCPTASHDRQGMKMFLPGTWTGRSSVVDQPTNKLKMCSMPWLFSDLADPLLLPHLPNASPLPVLTSIAHISLPAPAHQGQALPVNILKLRATAIKSEI